MRVDGTTSLRLGHESHEAWPWRPNAERNTVIAGFDPGVHTLFNGTWFAGASNGPRFVGVGRDTGARRPPVPPDVRSVYGSSRCHLPAAMMLLAGAGLSHSAVTLDAPLTLPRRFRRLLPAADSGISAILSSVCFVIKGRAPPLGVRPSAASSWPTMPWSEIPAAVTGLVAPFSSSSLSRSDRCRLWRLLTARPRLSVLRVASSATRRQTSRVRAPPSRICPPHLLSHSPCRYWTSSLCAPSSNAAAWSDSAGQQSMPARRFIVYRVTE